MQSHPRFWAKYALHSALLFCAYYFSAQWALDVYAVHQFAAPIWPPSGIALTALFFGGYRLWPAIAFAAFFVNYSLEAPLLAAIGVALGNTLEAWIACYLLKSLRFSPLLNKLSDSVGFIATAFSAPFISAVIGPTVLLLFNVVTRQDLPLTSITWWIGDVLGILVLAPFLLRWFSRSVFDMRRTIPLAVEAIVFFIITIVISILIFLDPIPQFSAYSLPYLVFIPLTWGALRIGPRFVTSAIVIVAAIATMGTLINLGQLVATSSKNELVLLQLFLINVSTIFLLFVAAVEERKETNVILRKNVESLKKDVSKMSSEDRAKNEFIAILSHELRNPLAPVLSSLELMRLDTAASPAIRESIDAMQGHINRITRLLDDLLDITRISQKKFTLDMKKVDLRAIVEHSTAMTEDTFKKRSQVLSATLPQDPLLVYADPLRLEQVVVNLLNNAAKYTELGGRISVLLERVATGAEIRIRDSGIGIERNKQREIFEPFRQVNGSDGKGLGIGLSLAKRFVELHSGTISVESEGLGRGSEFIVFLPLAPSERETNPVQSSQKSSGANSVPKALSAPTSVPQLMGGSNTERKTRSVLIVDSDTDTANTMGNILTYAGHTTKVAYGVRSALQTLALFRPEMILLAVDFPGEASKNLALKIRREVKPIPLIVALAQKVELNGKEQILSSDFDFTLVKPVSIADLEFILTKYAHG